MREIRRRLPVSTLVLKTTFGAGRYDDCHVADWGEVKSARAWAALLATHLNLARSLEAGRSGFVAYADTERGAPLRMIAAHPTAAKPRSIIAQVEASGAAAGV